MRRTSPVLAIRSQVPRQRKPNRRRGRSALAVLMVAAAADPDSATSSSAQAGPACWVPSGATYPTCGASRIWSTAAESVLFRLLVQLHVVRVDDYSRPAALQVIGFFARKGR